MEGVPDLLVFDDGIAVDQQVTEADDFTDIGDAMFQFRHLSQGVIESFADDLEFTFDGGAQHA